MGSESLAHEFSKIQLVGQKYQDKTTLASKTRFSNHCFGFQSQTGFETLFFCSVFIFLQWNLPG